MKRGRLITVEGMDGSGKSSLCIPCLRELFKKKEIPCRFTREPGGTVLADRIREVLLRDVQEEPMAAPTELLLVFAARAQHLQEVIRPALENGEWVVCDRFTDSTYVYQGRREALSREAIAWLEQWVQGELRPDLTLLLDLPASEAIRRLKASSRPRMSYFDRQDLNFFERIREAYLHQAREAKRRFAVIDAAGNAEQVSRAIAGAVEQRLGLKRD